MKTEVTIEMFCPCCMETHQIKTLWIEELNKFKGVEFNAPAKTYRRNISRYDRRKK